MHKKYRKKIVALIMALALPLCFMPDFISKADTDYNKMEAEKTENIETATNTDGQLLSANITINAANFPDTAFRNYISLMIDKDKNGVLSVAEQEAVTSITISESMNKEHGTSAKPFANPANLSGIGCFVNLKTLSLDTDNKSFTSLSLSSNTNITDIYVETPYLSSIDVSKNIKLTALSLDTDAMTNIDLSNNTALTFLELTGTKFTAPVLKTLTNLSHLNMVYCKNITAIDLSANKSLTWLSLNNMSLSEIDLENNKNLTHLSLSGNKFTDIDLSNNTALTTLDLSYNKFTTLDLSYNTKLTGINTSGNNTYIQAKDDRKATITSVSGLTKTVIDSKVTFDTTTCTKKDYDIIFDKKSGGKYISTALYKYDCGGGNIVTFGLSLLEQPGITKLSNNTTGLTVNWNKTTDAKGYYLYRRTSGKSWSRLATISSGSTVSYRDNAVTPGVTYAYTVRAIGDKVVSCADLTGVNLRYLKMPTLAAPVNVSTGVKVRWAKTAGATGYYVYRKISGGGYKKVATISGQNTVSYIDKGVSSGYTYLYTVKAIYIVNGELKSYSGYYAAGKTIKYLKQPSVSGSSVKGRVTIKWSKTIGASGYYVYRRSFGGKWSRIATVKGSTAVSYIDWSAKKGGKYFYTVRAYTGSYLSSFYSGVPILGK